jgi:hypothetical protein
MQMKIWAAMFYLGTLAAFAAVTPNEAPRFDELYRLLKSNLKSISAEELDRAAARGLLEQLHAQVVLVTNAGAASAESSSDSFSRETVFDRGFAYFRVGRLTGNLAQRFANDFQQLSGSNKLKGLILDLRYADGDNFAGAAELADKFLKSEVPLLDWGKGEFKSKTKSDAVSLPVAILVNHETAGAAEALAAMLRANDVGLLIGSATAGQLSVFKEFALENGQRVRIATMPVKLAGGKTLPAEGLNPDIQVALSAQEELGYYEDSFKIFPRPALTNSLSSATATNLPRRRLNEAELVRLQREGLSPDGDLPPTSPRPARDPDQSRSLPSDPALVRALDLLKGLAVVQQQKRSL